MDSASVLGENPDDVNEVVITTPSSGVGLPQEMICPPEIVDPASSSPRRPSSKPSKKKKLYEFCLPFNDAFREKKRLNAIKAKRHRELAKQKEAALEGKLREVVSENERLRSQVKTLTERVEQLEQKKKEIQDMVLTLNSMLHC
ncbi:CCAAT/enhancer-binding protein delta-like [Macrobrachium rosenbergii]|uniref:CCAAT/enhancer-binding protein delta-like n=1 Tax=Macrobrachium rosenbergii TaxID=79674 RepID=UPI0034D3EFBB